LFSKELSNERTKIRVVHLEKEQKWAKEANGILQLEA
jgi:hypothetical protein